MGAWPMKYLKPQQIADTLVEILPGMFAKAGLTVVDVAPTACGLFSFRVREFNPALCFNYDGLCLEMTVSHQGQVIDCLAMAGVPLVAVNRGRYFPYWSGNWRFGAACSSIGLLMRRYLQRQINHMARMAQAASIDIFQTGGLTMARLVDRQHQSPAEDMAYFVASIRVMVSDP